MLTGGSISGLSSLSAGNTTVTGTVRTTGPVNQVQIDDRDGSGHWVLYSQSDTLRFYEPMGGDKMALTANGSLSLGSTASAATATPVVLSLGGTYSTSAGANPKLKLWDSGGLHYGLGVSAGQLDYMVPTGDGHSFWSGASEVASVTSTGISTTGTYKVNETQVVGARRSGWGAPTGTATRAAFDTATATTAQLAERIKALIDDLTAHGLIGS